MYLENSWLVICYVINATFTKLRENPLKMEQPICL